MSIPMNIVNSFIGVKVHKQPTKQSILTEGSKVGDKPVEEHDNHLFPSCHHDKHVQKTSNSWDYRHKRVSNLTSKHTILVTAFSQR